MNFCIYMNLTYATLRLTISGDAGHAHRRMQLARSPVDYSDSAMETMEHEELRRSIRQFYTNVYVAYTSFDFRIKNAVAVSHVSRHICAVCLELAYDQNAQQE